MEGMISSHHCIGANFSSAGPGYRFRSSRRLLGALLVEALAPIEDIAA